MTFWKVLLLLRRAKTCISIITVSKTVKLRRGFNGVWSQGWHQEKMLVPCYSDSCSPVSLHGCLQTQTRRDKRAFQLPDGLSLPETGQVPGQKSWSLCVIKSHVLCQDLINQSISIFQQEIFSIQRNMNFNSQHAYLHVSHGPITFIHTGAWLTVGIYCSQGCLSSRNDFNLQNIPPTNIWKSNWP